MFREMNHLPKPLSLHYATLLILGGMILEIIAIGAYTVRYLDGFSGVLYAYIIMALVAIGTVKYLIDLEKGRLRSVSLVVIGVLIQVILIVVTMYFEYTNVFFIGAVALEAVGTALLYHPRTMLWVREVQLAKSA